MARAWHLMSRPQGLPTDDNFALKDIKLPPLGPGQVRVRNDWLSVDPYMRGRMNDVKSYVPPFQLDQPMEGGAVGEIVESNAEGFAVGDRVLHMGGWRERRQSKRQLLSGIREHMEVVGNDDKHVGKVDRVAGDRIILTKSDPEAGGVHHSLGCADVDRVENDRVILDCSADKARERWRDENRDRALFEREDQGQSGPHILDRSFSGTYR